MNTLQRLMSNTLLAFISTAMVKVSNSILFIMVGRMISPGEAGSFTLGISYFTVVLALSTWGLQELLVREAAPRRQESGRYFVNYLAIRFMLSVAFYGLMLLFLRLNLPYSASTNSVIRIVSLAVLTESVFSICQALFTAHERLVVPTLGGIINSVVTLGVGYWFLQQGGGVTAVAWAVPIGSLAGLLIFPFAIIRLFRQSPQTAPVKLNWPFSREQLRATPGFILLGIFSTLNFQADTFIISLYLKEADVAFYGAAQTILQGFIMMPIAIRTSLYPLMARYKKSDTAKLAQLYQKANQYLLILVLPIAAGITLLARPIIQIIFTNEFEPAVPALQYAIWAVVFLFLTVPPARLMLVHNQQQMAGWLRGIGMVLSIGLNLWLIPRYGIVGASISRVLATATFYGLIYLFVHRNLQQGNLLSFTVKPILATLVMATAVYPIRHLFLLWPILVGAVVYTAAILLLKGVTVEDRTYLQKMVRK